MLNIVFGRENCQNVVDNPIRYFLRNKRPEWFEDDFVKRFLYEVDHSVVLFEEALKDYRGRGISSEKISTGCKTLCCIYYDTEGKVFNGSCLGNNCLPFLVEISEKKDVTVFMEHYADFPEKYFEDGKIAVDGKVAGQYDYDDAFSDWCIKRDPEANWEEFHES